MLALAKRTWARTLADILATAASMDLRLGGWMLPIKPSEIGGLCWDLVSNSSPPATLALPLFLPTSISFHLP